MKITESNRGKPGTACAVRDPAGAGAIQRDRLLWVMRQAGVTVEDLAAAIGTTPRTFMRKAGRQGEFTAREIEIIMEKVDPRPAFLLAVFFPEADACAAV